MRKIYTLLTGAMAAVTMTAGGLSLPAAQKRALTPAQPAAQVLTPAATPSSGIATLQKAPAKAPARAAEAETQWTAWEQIGTGSFNEAVVTAIKNQCSYYATSVPDWDGSFTLMQRKSTTDSSVAQLRLDNVFNNVNIVLNWDTETNAVTCDEANASTGIEINGDYGQTWEDFHLFISGACYYYPSTGKIVFGNLWLNIAPGWGLEMGAATLTLNDAPEYKFNVTAPVFTPSTSRQASVSVERSEQVSFYRVAVFDPLETPMVSTATDLMLRQPTGDKTYTDFKTDYFIVNFDQPGRYYAIVIPFGDEGNSIDTYTLATLYSNYQGSYSWTPLGTGSMTDIVGHIGLEYDFLYETTDNGPVLKAAPVTRDVEIEVRSDNPSIFRVKNPFGKSYPYYDHLVALVDSDDDFYLTIDATDPSRVNITYSTTGFYEYFYPSVAVSTNYTRRNADGTAWPTDQIDAETGSEWGKFADRRIVFPMHSVFVNNAHILYTHDFDLELLLPGYVDYSLDWEATSTPDESGNYTLSAPAGVTAVLCGVIPVETYNANINFPERLYAMVAEGAKAPAARATALDVHSFPVVDGKVSIPSEDITPTTYGTFVTVIVPVDASGEPHSGIISSSFSVTHPDDNWNYLGSALITENVPQLIYSGLPTEESTNAFRCEAYENNTQPGLFRLDNPYLPLASSWNVNYAGDRSLYIDATNPERVLFVTGYERNNFNDQYGFNTGLVLSAEGHISINTFANYNIFMGNGDQLTDNHFAKYSDNRIIVEGAKLVYGLPEANFLANSNEGLFMVELPDTGGVEDVTTSNTNSDAPVEYFNLHGVKITNPGTGIYIRRQGAEVEKVAIR